MYGINLLLTMIMISVTWRYAVRARLVRPDLADEDVKTLTQRLTPTLGIYVLMIVVGLFLPILAVFGYLALAIFVLVPFSALPPPFASALNRAGPRATIVGPGHGHLLAPGQLCESVVDRAESRSRPASARLRWPVPSG